MPKPYEKILEDRAIIIDNADKLIKYGNNFSNNKNQLSLFDSSNEAKPQIGLLNRVNYDDMIAKERDALGVVLTCDMFDKYILIKKRFCNNTVASISELTESVPNGMIVMAEVVDIEYKKSMSGNNYAKITLRDNGCSYRVYMWGNIYKTKISTVFKNSIYLVEVGYNNDTNSTFIINIKGINDINPKDHVKTIVMYIDSLKSVISVRQYIMANMFAGTTGDFDLTFNYKGDYLVAPYKITFNENDYLYLKEFITNIDIEK